MRSRHISLAPIYGYAPRGARLIAPFGAEKASLGQEHHAALEHDAKRDGAYSLAVEGATTARVFETYVKKVLSPVLQEGQR